MANPITAKSDGNLDSSSRHSSVSFISESFPIQRSQPKHIDELIVSLANSYENRRALQVSQWELMPRQYVQPAPLGLHQK